jgi:PRTRC genetic system protein E
VWAVEFSRELKKEGATKVFTELLPLLKQRLLMITVSDVGDGLLRVNVIPRKLDADSDQSQALTTPLSITGSAEELDRELPGQLLSFTESVVKTGSNLEELKTQHAAAVKAIDAENKKRLDEKKKGGASKTQSTPPARMVTSDFKDGKPLFGSKAAPAANECRGLFDGPTETADEVGGLSTDIPSNCSAPGG